MLGGATQGEPLRRHGSGTGLWTRSVRGWSPLEIAAVLAVVVLAGAGLGSKVIAGGYSSLEVVLDALNGVVLAGCALMLRRRRLQPWLMRLLLLGAGLWFAEDLVISKVFGLYELGAVFEDGFDPVLIQMLLSYPTGRVRSRFEGRLVCLSYVGAIGGGATRAVLHLANNAACGASCPVAALRPSWAYVALQDAQDAVAGAIAVVVVVILVRRHRASSSAARRRMQALAGAIPVIAVIYGVSLARSATGPWPQPEYAITSVLATVSALLFPICIVLGVMRADSLRARVAELALSRPDAAGAEEGLRNLLADVCLRIIPAGDPVANRAGDAGLPAGGPVLQEATPLVVDGARVGTLMHDPVLSVDPGLLTIVVSAAATALTHRESSVDPGSREAVGRLSARERSVLELMADGLSNDVIGRRLGISVKTVEKHVASMFTKLDLPAEAHLNRRVAAVVSYMRSGS